VNEKQPDHIITQKGAITKRQDWPIIWGQRCINVTKETSGKLQAVKRREPDKAV
jgi:hypothetical protein